MSDAPERPDPEVGAADGTSYREMAGDEEHDLGDADGTSYREIAREDDSEEDDLEEERASSSGKNG